MTSILLWSRNVELTCMYKKQPLATMSILHMTTELVSTPTKQSYCIGILNIS